MVVFMHCVALLSFSLRSLKVLWLWQERWWGIVFRLSTLAHVVCWLSFPVSTCSVPHCVIGSLCCGVCAHVLLCYSRNKRKRDKAVRRCAEVQQQSFHRDSRRATTTFHQRANPFLSQVITFSHSSMSKDRHGERETESEGERENEPLKE